MCESGISVGGFPQKNTRHTSWVGIFFFSRDLIAKQPYLLLPLDRNTHRRTGAPGGFQSPVARTSGSLDVARNRKRRTRGVRGCAHHGRRRREAAGFQRGAAAVMQAGSVLQVRQCSVGSTATKSEVRESAQRREPHDGLGLLSTPANRGSESQREAAAGSVRLRRWRKAVQDGGRGSRGS
jgi:hypothetical protein